MFVWGLAICLVLGLINAWTSELHPRTNWGMGYGIAAALLLLVALLYAARRRAPRRGPFAVHAWLQIHIYGGLLYLMLVLLHTGFGWPQGTLAWGLWLTSLWIVLSGLAGTMIQTWIPSLLTSSLSTEAHYDRIEGLVDELRNRARKTAHLAGSSVEEFHDEHVAPLMTGPQPRWIYFFDIRGGIHSRTRHFSHLRDILGGSDKQHLEEIRRLAVTKLELDVHYTLQRALRWWLYGHVPVSLVLAVLVGFHIFSILYY